MTLKFVTNPAPSYVYEEELRNMTLISRFENGAEQRRAKWSQSYRVFTLRYNLNSREEINRLWNFYLLCRGAFRTFEFTNFIEPMLPHDQTTVWYPLHEGEGTKINDWNGYIYPTYKVRFLEDRLSYEEFSIRLQKSELKLCQVEPISFTNNFGTISGATWAYCPDGSVCVNFDGVDDQISPGNVTALDIGTSNFSFAFGVYVNSFASTIGVLSKKADATTGTPGYHLVIGTNGQITVRISNGSVQNTIQSATNAIPVQTWKIITVTCNRSGSGSGQIYVDNVSSGSPVSLNSGNGSNTRSFFLGRTEGVAYGNCRTRNFLFAKKEWSASERNLVWNTWRGIFNL